jgi:TPR repeat protein
MYEREQVPGKNDPSQSVPLYQHACEQGDGPGCNSLGFMYEKGDMVKQDLGLAVQLYKRSCDLGTTYGCNNLTRAQQAQKTAESASRWALNAGFKQVGVVDCTALLGEGAHIYPDKSSLNTLETVPCGEEVGILSVDAPFLKVMTHSGKTGYVSQKVITNVQ